MLLVMLYKRLRRAFCAWHRPLRLAGLAIILLSLLLEHWLARRRSLNWINTAFFRLNALISIVFLIVTVTEVIFPGFRLRY